MEIFPFIVCALANPETFKIKASRRPHLNVGGCSVRSIETDAWTQPEEAFHRCSDIAGHSSQAHTDTHDSHWHTHTPTRTHSPCCCLLRVHGRPCRAEAAVGHQLITGPVPVSLVSMRVSVCAYVCARPTLSLSTVFWDVLEAMEMVSGWLLPSPWLSPSSPPSLHRHAVRVKSLTRQSLMFQTGACCRLCFFSFVFLKRI